MTCSLSLPHDLISTRHSICSLKEQVWSGFYNYWVNKRSFVRTRTKVSGSLFALEAGQMHAFLCVRSAHMVRTHLLSLCSEGGDDVNAVFHAFEFLNKEDSDEDDEDEEEEEEEGEGGWIPSVINSSSSVSVLCAVCSMHIRHSVPVL